MFGTFQCKMVETDLHKGLKEEKRKTEGIQSILYFLHNSYCPSLALFLVKEIEFQMSYFRS